jgi:hypothetical protein
MRVVFKGPKSMYDSIIDSFRKAKEADTWDVATLTEEKERAQYRTCCDNLWFAEKRDDCTVFGYEGTRRGATRLQPFSGRLYWSSCDPPELTYIEEVRELPEEDEYIDAETGGRTGVPVSKVRAKVFKLKVIDYQTSTPKEWGLEWYHQVERVTMPVDKDREREDIVIMDGHYPTKVFPGAPRPKERGSW